MANDSSLTFSCTVLIPPAANVNDVSFNVAIAADWLLLICKVYDPGAVPLFVMFSKYFASTFSLTSADEAFVLKLISPSRTVIFTIVLLDAPVMMPSASVAFTVIL